MGTVIYLKNKDTPINEAINEYIGYLDEKERLELSKEISSNPIFKNDFSERMQELSCMIYALASDNNSLFYELFSKFISRELSTNKHIINMYAFYLNNEDLISYYDEKYYNGKGLFIFNHIKYLMKQHNLYYHLDYKLDAEKSTNNQNMKAP